MLTSCLPRLPGNAGRSPTPTCSAARAAAGPRRQRLRRPRAGDRGVGARADPAPPTRREHPLALRPRRRQRAAPGDRRGDRRQHPGRRRRRPARPALLPSRVRQPTCRPLRRRRTFRRRPNRALRGGRLAGRPHARTPPVTCRCGSPTSGSWPSGTRSRTTTSAGSTSRSTGTRPPQPSPPRTAWPTSPRACCFPRTDPSPPTPLPPSPRRADARNVWSTTRPGRSGTARAGSSRSP